ncbi:MAG: fibronectin type III domain-containing protein [Patescibacteria group bacterium]
MWRYRKLVAKVLILALVFGYTFIFNGGGQRSTVPRAKAGAISSVSVTPSSATKGASANYTIKFTPATALSGSSFVSINIFGPPDASFNLGSVQSAGLGAGTSSSIASIENVNVEASGGSVGLQAQDLPASEVTVVLQNIVNPPKSGKYQIQIFTYQGMAATDSGMGTVTIGTIALSGTVKNPGGTGVGGVYIEAQDKTDFSARFGSSTDDNGNYGIGDLTSGRTYIVRTFINPDPNGAAKGFVPADDYEFTYAGTATTHDFTLKNATKTITGKITRQSGAVVANGRVAAMRTDGPGFMNTEADVNGNYTLRLAGGRWEIRPDTYAGPGQTAPDYAYSGPGTMVKFTKDETIESKADVNFTVVTASATIKGAVSPNPGGFAGVGIFNKSGFGTGTGLDPQNASFSVRVPPGSYNIDMFMDPSQAGDKYMMPERDPITVSDNETKDLGTITLTKMDKTISATVRENVGKSGLPNFEVGCFRVRGQGFTMGRTGADGVASIPAVNGEWGCMAFTGMGGPKGEGGPGGEEGGPMGFLRWLRLAEKAYAQEGQQASQKYVVMGGPQFVTVADNTPTATFDALVADRSIGVTIQDSSGNNVQEHGFIEAELVSSDAGDNFDKGGGLGQPIDPNMPGMATMQVPAGVYDLFMMTPPGSDYSAGDVTRVDVTSGNATAVIKLLANDSTISGTLKDEDGNTVKNIFAFVTASNSKGAFIPGDVNSADGTYSMRVPSAGGKLNLGYFVDPKTGYFPQPFSDAAVTPVAGQTHTKDIVMKKATTTVAVTVKDPSGNAVANAFVEADNRKTDSFSKIDHFFNTGNLTDANGQATLSLPADDYTLKAFLPPETLRNNNWLPPKGSALTLAKNDSKSLTLTFQAADVTLAGKVSKSDGTAVNSAFVTAYSKDGESIETTTDSSGNYTMKVASGEWRVVAEKDELSTSSAQPTPLLAKSQGLDTSSAKSFTENLTVASGDALSSPVTTTFDTDNSKLVKLTDGSMSGAQVSIPQDALDLDGEGNNATLTARSTVELPHHLLDKPLGDAGLDISVSDSSGQSISSTNSSVAITIPIERGDLTGAGLEVSDIGKKATMSYYDEENGKWAPLEGSVNYIERDANSDGDLTDATDEILVTGQSSHFTSFAVTAATDSTAPSAPTNIAASAGDSKVTLSWSNPTESDLAGIKIYRSTTEGTVGDLLTTISNTTTTSYENTGLTNGTKYYYVVKSYDSTGNISANTSQVSGTPGVLPVTGIAETAPDSIWAKMIGLLASLF